MKVAQELYEGIDVDGSGPVGLITYMRTDSLRVSDEAMTAVREKIKNEFGDRYLPAKPIRYAAGKNAQEAHEAIRPTDAHPHPGSDQGHAHPRPVPALPAHLRPVRRQPDGPGRLHGDRRRDRRRRRAIQGAGQGAEVRRPPPGLAARAASRKTSCCRVLTAGSELDLHSLDATQHFTQPPPRYSEATLIKALEKEAIGRPSTYAPIIQTIQDRGYVEQKERRFHATHLGMAVTDLLVEQFPKILDLKFTAQMEDELDDIATAKEEMTKVLDEFYYPFQEELKAAETHMERVQIPTNEVCHLCNSPMVLKFGKTGQFLGCSKYPECKATRPLGGQPRAEAVESEHIVPEVRQEALDPRKQAQREVPFLLGLSRVQGVVQHRPRGQSRPVGGRDRIQVREMRQADGVAPGLARSVPRLHGIPQVPQCCCRSTTRGSPVQPVKVEVACTKCGGAMAVRRGRRGSFLGCTNYPKCRGTAPIPDELKDKLAEAGRRRPPPPPT